MTLMKIITGTKTPILRTVCDPVKIFDKSLKKLVRDMTTTMKTEKGLGIAAPQVNVNARVIIVTLGFKENDPQYIAMVNPQIADFSAEKVIGEEGCLSLPGLFGNVERAQEIVVKYFDPSQKEHILKLNDMDARVVQHETDHLNGILFEDKLMDAVVM
jgi:peptide deformylase